MLRRGKILRQNQLESELTSPAESVVKPERQQEDKAEGRGGLSLGQI